MCFHLNEFKSKYGCQSYKIIYSFFIRNYLSDIKSSQKIWLTCFHCDNESNYLFSCLSCVYFGCFEEHVLNHLNLRGHKLYVDLSNGFIYCTICKDYVYDRDFEEIALQHRMRRKDALSYLKWRPTESEIEIIKQHRDFIQLLPQVKYCMRGIVNIGDTCFMNSIVQALVHTPLLRNYFFTDQHSCQSVKSTDCLECIFSRLYQKYYSDDTSNLVLQDMVYYMWKNASNHLVCGKQNDAHEFFFIVVNVLHQAPENSKDKHSIIDTIFHMKVQSDLVCLSCSYVSTTVDPYWDVPLDIPDLPTTNLLECLNHFTRAETLESKVEMECSGCGTYPLWTKQLTFQKLPIVIVIHLKRFQLDASLDEWQKKSTYVPFPTDLDMTPFMSGHRNMPSAKEYNDSVKKFTHDYRYTLYAVIVHRGEIDTGHFLTYIRSSQDIWYKCSDVLVAPATLDDVKKSEAYMLFYHKTVLNYH